MKISDDLFNLIHSLTKSEKGYFKKTSFHIRGEKNNYTRLFDAIEKQDLYDESALLELFKHERFVKQFSVAKNYLYEHLLKSMETFHTTYNSEVKSLIHQSVILNKKGLYNQSLKRLMKAKEIAAQINNYPVLYEILQKIGPLLQYVSFPSSFSFKKLTKELDDALNDINNFHNYIGLEDALTSFIFKHGSIRNKKHASELTAIMKHPFLKNEKMASTTKSKMLYHNIHFLFESLNQKTELNKDKHLLAILELIQHNHPFIKEHFDVYLSLLNNLLLCYSDLRHENKFYQTLQKMRDAANDYKIDLTPNLKLRIFQRVYINELSFYAKTGRFEKITNKAADIEKEMTEFKNIRTDPAWERVICYNVAYLFFGIKNYNEALYWLNKIFESEEIGSREDIYSFAKILQLIIHYEFKKDEDVLYKVSQSIHTYLTKKKKLFGSEKIILKFIEKYPGVKSEKELTALYASTKKEFEKISDKPTEKIAFQYLDYLSWLDSKIEKQDFLSIYREKVKGKV